MALVVMNMEVKNIYIYLMVNHVYTSLKFKIAEYSIQINF